MTTAANTHAADAADTHEILRAIRASIRASVSEDGIFLTARYRYHTAAQDLADLVRQLPNALVIQVVKTGKVTMQNYTATKPSRVTFTVGIEADQYLAGRINFRQYRAMVARA